MNKVPKAFDEIGTQFLPDKDPEQEDEDKFGMISNIVEKYAFIVFFILFVIYNMFYWSWLYNSSGYLDWPEINPLLNSLNPTEKTDMASS